MHQQTETDKARDALRVLTTINSTADVKDKAFAMVDDSLRVLAWIEQNYPQVIGDGREAITD